MAEKKEESNAVARLILRIHENQNKEGVDRLKKELEEKEGEAKLHFILKKLKDAVGDERRELLKNLDKAIEDGATGKNHLAYESFQEGLEGPYFWLLNFFTHQLGFKVNKTKDDFEASVGSTFFSEIGGKATRMQEQAMKMMGSINTVLRSIINLIYDLKEFEIRLEAYDKYRSQDEKALGLLQLKQIWMDQVDVKKGVGSINGLAQQLQFVTLRDAFLNIPNAKAVDGKDVDLNKRVKRILKQKLGEFETWVDYSEKELKNRFKIEQSYLKSQVASLKMYAEWTKPYLIAAKKLGMKDFNSPNIVNMFNNSMFEIELIGEAEVKAQGMIDSGELPEHASTTQKMYAVGVVRFEFRSTPHSVSTPQGYSYRQGGKFNIKFYALGLPEDELKALKEAKEDEALSLLDDMVDTSLSTLADDLKRFMEDDVKKEEKKQEKAAEEREKRNKRGPFSFLWDGVKDAAQPVKNLFNPNTAEYFDQKVLDEATSSAEARVFVLYDVYKKAHGMLSV